MSKETKSKKTVAVRSRVDAKVRSGVSKASSFRDGSPLTLATWKKRLAGGYYSSVTGARRATGHAVRCGNMTAAEKARADKLAGEHKYR